MTNPNDNQSFTNRGANDPLMIKHQPDSLDDILKDFGLEVSGGDFTKEQFLKAKAAIQALIDKRVLDGKIDLISWCLSRTSTYALKRRWRELEDELEALSAKHSSKEEK